MIESIHFQNFKALRDATLLLSPCTILVGPNGSGKSTVLEALDAVRDPHAHPTAHILSAGAPQTSEAVVQVKLEMSDPHRGAHYSMEWSQDGRVAGGIDLSRTAGKCDRRPIESFVSRMRAFSLDSRAIASPATVRRNVELDRNGSGLASVLDRLCDTVRGRFDAINSVLGEWLPEFDDITFDVPADGTKSVVLRTRDGHHAIRASDLSQGTLIALALLTLAYLPDPPSLIGLEEPDRGIHPRLLRHVRDAIYRLTNPESCGEQREPVQVIATTHSPYFLDLFKDHPEEIVLTSKVGLDVQFQRLTDQPHIEEILGGAPLGDVWFSGVLGGVPDRS